MYTDPIPRYGTRQSAVYQTKENPILENLKNRAGRKNLNTKLNISVEPKDTNGLSGCWCSYEADLDPRYQWSE